MWILIFLIVVIFFGLLVKKENFSNSQGYILNCFGDENYFTLTKRIITNIRTYDSDRRICILTDNPVYFDNDYIQQNNIIVKKFVYESHPTLYGIDMNIPWNKYGLVPKLFHSYYTPFKNTMFLDVDMQFKKDFTFVWEKYNGGVLCIGRSDENNKSPSQWHWGHIDEVIQSSGINIPETFTTFMMYDDSLKIYIDKHVSYILENIDNWKIKKQYKDGIPDEIIYAIVFGIESIRPDESIYEWILSNENCDPFSKE
jgi:hypothetical protein